MAWTISLRQCYPINPYFNMVELNGESPMIVKQPANKIERRQDAPLTYDMNGSTYAWKRALFWMEQSFSQRGQGYMLWMR